MPKQFNLIVAGGRDYLDYKRMENVLFEFAEQHGEDYLINIVSGMSRGADRLAVQFCRNHGVQLIEMPADWNQYGKSAGYRRNTDMAAISQGLIAFWDKSSKGTQHMISTAQSNGLIVQVEYYQQTNNHLPFYLPL